MQITQGTYTATRTNYGPGRRTRKEAQVFVTINVPQDSEAEITVLAPDGERLFKIDPSAPVEEVWIDVMCLAGAIHGVDANGREVCSNSEIHDLYREINRYATR